MSSGQAAKMLGCTEWTVRKLFREGLLSGWKPGAARKRSDGRASNAALVLDAGSVLRYKESVSQKGMF
jgi:excisionase family DNA binding protein